MASQKATWILVEVVAENYTWVEVEIYLRKQVADEPKFTSVSYINCLTLTHQYNVLQLQVSQCRRLADTIINA